MKYIADFHIHSKYSRATSKNMDLKSLDEWTVKKGINIIGTGDFTHPQWLAELKKELEPAEEGLYILKSETLNTKSRTRFILTVEISSIYSKGGKARRIHNLIFAPSLKIVEKINAQLGLIGNLKSDGRPILGLDAKELAKIILNISPDCMIIPAHAWTPWFSIFGSMSGFDSIEECFEEYSKYIYAIETGLSSDPSMNRRLSALDNITLISNSDSHSARKIGREANVLELENLSYPAIIAAIKNSSPKNLEVGLPNKILYTVEFFPEEGKYHYDGHKNCGVCFSPQETEKHGGICPVCKKPLVIGVMNRVDKLADRLTSEKPKNAIPYKNLIPLEEIIAEALNRGVNTKSVQAKYEDLILKFNNEFNILLDTPIEEINQATDSIIVEGIQRMREGKIKIQPGYDGEYGKIKIFDQINR